MSFVVNFVVYTVFSIIIILQVIGLIHLYRDNFGSNAILALTEASLNNLEKINSSRVLKVKALVLLNSLITITLSILFMIGSTESRVLFLFLFILTRYVFASLIKNYIKNAKEI
ncbi:hypothetical protein NIE88_08530 [Sporolactobacillus shoreicorticis]|uniref:Uncharacterized protein n=1 Tax=Sporolactobacillus shoreicorticis TaxID=1923877 RepID=A0ABW5S2C9_9BACL|nr:hypothetical protein [Sporolactobacillus shoreicorticis]MCO7125815.1 hypothetical protein [Sporolactobacillus shoreicorticis]